MGIEKEIAPVLAVALITWGGVFFYILRLDRLAKSLERDVEVAQQDKPEVETIL